MQFNEYRARKEEGEYAGGFPFLEADENSGHLVLCQQASMITIVHRPIRVIKAGSTVGTRSSTNAGQ